MKSELHVPLFDTPADSQVSISLDIGVIPKFFPNAGQYVITLQAHPLPDRKSAGIIADAIKEAVSSRLGIKMR